MILTPEEIAEGWKPYVGNIVAYRFIEPFGEDAKPTDPYDSLEWDEDGLAIVVSGGKRPDWLRDDDLVRFFLQHEYTQAGNYHRAAWAYHLAFQIKRRPKVCECCGQEIKEKME